jgi:hypothetical protein
LKRKRILILGATGEMGKYVTIGLASEQLEYRIFIKARKKA